MKSNEVLIKGDGPALNPPDRCSRAVLWLIALFVLAIPLYFLFFKAPVSGQIAEGSARLVVTAVLLFFLLRRKGWARLVLVFFALAGSSYLIVRLVFIDSGLDLEIMVKCIGYTVSGLVLAFSKTAMDCFDIKKKTTGESDRVSGSEAESRRPGQ